MLVTIALTGYTYGSILLWLSTRRASTMLLMLTAVFGLSIAFIFFIFNAFIDPNSSLYSTILPYLGLIGNAILIINAICFIRFSHQEYTRKKPLRI